jgi:hypothetical protein
LLLEKKPAAPKIIFVLLQKSTLVPRGDLIINQGNATQRSFFCNCH